MKRTLFFVGGFFLIIVLIIPSLIVLPFSGQPKTEAATSKATAKPAVKASVQGPAITVAVYRKTADQVDSLPIHDYIVGVVASEMPAEFNIEALKAQALSARTYIVNRLLNKKNIEEPKNAIVNDTPENQVYKSKAELKKAWGSDYDWKIKKIEKAVTATAGQIITYKDKPITASFFSTSNGYTENAQDYWTNAIPYLKSVKSPWDIKDSPKYLDTVTIPDVTVEKDLKVTLPKKDGSVVNILKKTAGHRVATCKIGGKQFTGREVREDLNLRSSDFTMKRQGSNIVITTKGYGHGVGMSQYGANGMANEGKSYKDIVKYYYTGVDVSSLSPFLNKLTAKK